MPQSRIAMLSKTLSLLAALTLCLGACAVDVDDGDETVTEGSSRIHDLASGAGDDGAERDSGKADGPQAAAQADTAPSESDNDSPGVADLEAIVEPDPQPWEPDETDDPDEM
jgi:hypothetical protein